MPYCWPSETVFRPITLEVGERCCQVCGAPSLKICYHGRHRFFTLDGPVELVSKLARCADVSCRGHNITVSPEAETFLVMPRWVLGWDAVCWLGHRRCARHWSVPQIREELADSYQIRLSEDAVEQYVGRYQRILAARQQDAAVLAKEYQGVKGLILSIDGLQPEKGHETLYVVREVGQKRVWFGEALLCSSAAEVRRLLRQARQWAERLGIPVRGWLSDKQDAFVTGIAAEFPGVPHRYCINHFLRDVAKPVLEADSHAKVKMRRKVRGLRALEREVLKARPTPAAGAADVTAAEAALAAGAAAVPASAGDQVVLDYCTAVRGILNDDQGGPLHPPGLRMAEALGEVQASLQRNLAAKKGGAHTTNCGVWPTASTGARPLSKRSKRRSASR
ncbi:MAG: hypothetical protein AAB289_01295 [Chloroflexota bacterium]